MDFNKYGGRLFEDMIRVAKSDKQGWVNYKWPHPGAEEINEQTSYIITDASGYFFCGVGGTK